MSLLSLALAGCGLLSAVSPQASGPGAPIALVRCDPYPSALCLQSFGLDQNQLLITFYFPAAGSTSFYLEVSTPGSITKYPCTTAETSPSMLYCTGPLIDLGTPIKIDLFTATGRTPLAEGDFTLIDLALPTLEFANQQIPSAATVNPVVTLPFQPTPAATLPLQPTPTPNGLTPGAGTAYPNPTLP